MAIKFQSTPARSGRHALLDEYGYQLPVSIHARAKRATLAAVHLESAVLVSIHARAKRATRALAKGLGVESVSIHARAKRATVEHNRTRNL